MSTGAASGILRPRRYYLFKRQALIAAGDPASAGIWRGKQEAQPGTPLPATTPHLTKLATLGYEMVEDVDGATQEELESAGLTRREAAAVLAALE